MKSKILINIDLPPPMHGMTYINSIIYKNLKNEKNYFFNILNKNDSLISNEKITISKLFNNIKVILNFWIKFFKIYPDTIYYIVSGSKYGILRDVVMNLPILAFNKRLVLHLHGFTHYKTYKESFMYKILFKLISKNSKLIVLCDKQKEKTKIIMHQDSVVLHNCLDEELCVVAKKKDENNTLRVCYISNISEAKGTLDLMKAVQNKLNIQLVVAGSFLVNEEEFHDLIEKSDNITYVGFANEDKKKEILINTDVFCLPSKLEEGSPISIIEAMSYGLPILSTNKGCIKNMINNVGFVLEDDYTKDDILGGLNYINQNYDELSMNAINEYKENYSEKKFVQKIKNILQGEIKNV